MKKTVIYRYLGTNGILETPIHLEDVFYVRLLQLTAETGKMLTDGNQKTSSIKIPEEDLDKWSEIDE